MCILVGEKEYIGEFMIDSLYQSALQDNLSAEYNSLLGSIKVGVSPIIALTLKSGIV